MLEASSAHAALAIKNARPYAWNRSNVLLIALPPPEGICLRHIDLRKASHERHQAHLEELRAALEAGLVEHAVAVGELDTKAFREVPVHHGRKPPELAAEDALVVEVVVREVQH